MGYDTPTTSQAAASSAGSYFAIGTELLGEVQRIIGQSKIKALRFNLGGRQLKEIPVNPATAVATVLLVVAAVVISNLRVEVVKDPQ